MTRPSALLLVLAVVGATVPSVSGKPPSEASAATTPTFVAESHDHPKRVHPSAKPPKPKPSTYMPSSSGPPRRPCLVEKAALLDAKAKGMAETEAGRATLAKDWPAMKAAALAGCE